MIEDNAGVREGLGRQITVTEEEVTIAGITEENVEEHKTVQISKYYDNNNCPCDRAVSTSLCQERDTHLQESSQPMRSQQPDHMTRNIPSEPMKSKIEIGLDNARKSSHIGNQKPSE